MGLYRAALIAVRPAAYTARPRIYTDDEEYFQWKLEGFARLSGLRGYKRGNLTLDTEWHSCVTR